jgi:hypothetical protein
MDVQPTPQPALHLLHGWGGQLSPTVATSSPNAASSSRPNGQGAGGGAT